MGATARKNQLADMTWVEFRERMAEKPVILLPFGSQEEQGPHAPMGDFRLAEKVTALIAERADAIAAPIVPFGYADFFRAIPGGIQLRAQTFCSLLEDMAAAFLDHGLEHLVIVNGHTSNAPLIDQTVRRIKAERGIAIPALHLWRLMPPSVWTRLHGANAAAARGHGADPLTSIGRYLQPELMRDDLAASAMPRGAFGLPAAGLDSVAFEGVPIALPLDVTDVTANGVVSGDPSLGSAAIGAEMVEWITAFAARFITHFRACDPRDFGKAPV
jgi:creatinine amidohydrolase